MTTKTLHLISLGCTKNLVDSEVMLGRLSQYSLVDDVSKADVIIINTCGFIEAAKEESIQTILEASLARKKDSLLVVSGCLTQRYQEELSQNLPEVDIFTGVGDYDKIDALIEEKQNRFTPIVYLIDENVPRVVTGSNYHAYIKIAEGCNQSCSFCAIPQFKGKLHSRTLDSIVKEVTNLVDKGFWDFSFISQDSSSYGRDMGIKDGLIKLIGAVEKIEGVKSARILYLYPSTTSFELIDAIADSKVFQSYYDMPIQHIDDRMLKVMKRGANEEKTKALLEYMQAKENAFIRTTLIAGHPHETQEAFDRLCQYTNDFGFDRVNVFAYSNEESTSAYKMEQLSPKVIKQRTKFLGAIASEVVLRSLEKMVDKILIAVVDGTSEEHEYLLSARPLAWERDIDGEILINDTSDLEVVFGGRYKVHVTQLVGGQLLGTLLEAA